MKPDLMMKKGLFLLTVLSALIISSCQGLFLGDRVGQAIMFTATSQNDVMTKTAYSGQVINGRERIDWENGDPVKVYMYWQNPSLEWQGQGKAFDMETRVYSVVNVHEGDDKKESHGNLATKDVNDRFVWDSSEKKYEFFSVYPAKAFSDNALQVEYQSNNPWSPDSRVSLSLDLPSNQPAILSENMKSHAYLAAAASSATYTSTDNGQRAVELRYYPMVTTMYVTLTNNRPSKTDVVLQELRLSNTQKYNNEIIPLVGTYSARLNAGSREFIPSIPEFNQMENKNNEVVLSFDGGKKLAYGESVDVAFFVLPRDYESKYLNLSIVTAQGTITKSLRENNGRLMPNVSACKKYNMHILLGEKKAVITDISDGGAQMICQFLSYLYENQQSVLRDAFPDLDDFINNRYNPKLKNKKNITAADLYGDENGPGALTEDDLRILQDLFDSMTELHVISQVGDGIVSDIEAKDFQIFPNLQKIELFIAQEVDIKISVEGLEKLTEFSIFQGSHGTIDLNISTCPNLTTVDLSQAINVTAIDVTIDSCPRLTDYRTSSKVRNTKITNCNGSVNTE